MKHRLFASILLAALAIPASAAQSPDFPRRGTFIIQLTSSQYSSGFGEYLVPPLLRAFKKTGMVYSGGAGAQFAATVQIGSDVGKWYGKGASAEWLYERSVTVGLSPASMDIEPKGKLTPAFSATAKLLTSNPDRTDELNCLIALATRELAARYRAKGRIVVDGEKCARN